MTPAEVLAFVAGLATLLARAASRLAAAPAVAPVATERPEPDRLLDVREAAALLRRSESWMRHHGHRLPGFSQPGGKGTRATWSQAGLTQWAKVGV